MSQPRIIRGQTKTNNYIGINQAFIELKAIFTGFNINEHEALFDKLPAIFGNDYIKTAEEINNYKESMDKVVYQFSKNLAQKVKELFDADAKSSLASVFEDWISETNANQRILEDKEKTFVSLFETKDYDDISMINSISKNLIRTKIADWEKDNTDEILNFISTLRDSIESKKLITELVETSSVASITDEEEISVMGSLLMNNIEEAFEEFADSVSNEEKIKILTKLIKEMI